MEESRYLEKAATEKYPLQLPNKINVHFVK